MFKKISGINIKWTNVFVLAYFHVVAIYSLFNFSFSLNAIIFGIIFGVFTGFGTTVGAHRYFCHKSFKANKILHIFLICLQTLNFQEPAIKWVREHRVHHKFSSTNADRVNVNRGFFFAHIGWMVMCDSHPEVIKERQKINMSDLESDPILQFQKKLEEKTLNNLIKFNFQVFYYFEFYWKFCDSNFDSFLSLR